MSRGDLPLGLMNILIAIAMQNIYTYQAPETINGLTGITYSTVHQKKVLFVSGSGNRMSAAKC